MYGYWVYNGVYRFWRCFYYDRNKANSPKILVFAGPNGSGKSTVTQAWEQVGRAVVKLVELSADERARDLYERREKERRDISSQKKWAAKQMQIDIAKNLLLTNLTTNEISTATGLTCEEVYNLRAN